MFKIDEDTSIWIFLTPIIILALLLCYSVWKNIGKASELENAIHEKSIAMEELKAYKGLYKTTYSNVEGSRMLVGQAENELDICRQQVIQLQDELALQSLEQPAQGVSQ